MTKNNTNVVLGIDPGFGSLGYGVIESSKTEMRALCYGVLKTPSFQPFTERLKTVYDEIVALIKRYQPNRMAIEKLFFEKNTKTAIDVAQARGVVLLAAVHGHILTVDCTPLQVKLAVTGYGAADKRQVQHMITLLLKLPKPLRQDDAADALAIAYCGISLTGSPPSRG
ncbi:MAG: crossover junction endodeoxyribonuclease RuvC [Patescibacteria group bacterium]